MYSLVKLDWSIFSKNYCWITSRESLLTNGAGSSQKRNSQKNQHIHTKPNKWRNTHVQIVFSFYLLSAVKRSDSRCPAAAVAGCSTATENVSARPKESASLCKAGQINRWNHGQPRGCQQLRDESCRAKGTDQSRTGGIFRHIRDDSTYSLGRIRLETPCWLA